MKKSRRYSQKKTSSVADIRDIVTVTAPNVRSVGGRSVIRSSSRSRSKTKTQHPELVIVQDVLEELRRHHKPTILVDDSNALHTININTSNDDGSSMDDDTMIMRMTTTFFDLANANEIGYRVHRLKPANEVLSSPSNGYGSSYSSSPFPEPGENMEEEDLTLVIHQDIQACGRHTGGIVWETSYLLLEYLHNLYPPESFMEQATATSTKANIDSDSLNLTRSSHPMGRTLEVGAGCGLLGLVTAYREHCSCMVLTEVHPVYDNLLANLQRNNFSSTHQFPASRLHACHLDWLDDPRDQVSKEPEWLARPFDTILGTDVLFAPHLVIPLVTTLRTHSQAHSVVYLCVQNRCPTSHALFFEQISSSADWDVQTLTQELASIPTCAWGVELECQLLRLIRRSG